MQQAKSRGAVARSLMAFNLIAFFAAGLAFGQTGQGMRFEVPYAFTFGSTVIPAGTYTFSLTHSRLTVASATIGPVSQNIITAVSGPAELFRDGSLVFDKTDGGLILSEVWIPGMDGLLLHSIPKGHHRAVLSAPYLNQTRTYSGKAAYNLTCAKCHGPAGNGYDRADKYFNIKIPRLNSAEVQRKSDAELRQLIANGTSKMPPVEIDESGFRHRLPPQDVDAVIAYVHTLKKR